MAEKRYYWLRLKRDFFKRHDIQIIENMPNGKDYVLFYLKLMVESIDHEGALRFSDTIPYNEQMLSVITNTNIDVVRAAMKMFQELGMIEVMDDNTLYMREVQALVGSETKWAQKKRDYRLKKGDNVPALSEGCLPNVRQEKEKEKEKEKDIEKEKECKKETTHTLFLRLISDYTISDDLRAKLTEWVKYKMERRESYKEQGMKSLLRQIENNAKEYGDQALIALIDECMASNWKGIIFDRLKQKKGVRKSNGNAAGRNAENEPNKWGNVGITL